MWKKLFKERDGPASYKKFPLEPEIAKKARLLALAGDETRIRIFCFMYTYGKACVTDIAESLEMNINTVSHHLRVMKDNGLLTSERMGTSICYILERNDFTNNLEKVICGSEHLSSH